MLFVPPFDNDLLQRIVVSELDKQCLLPLRTAQHPRLGLIAYHREAHLYGVFAVQLHAELSLEVGHRQLSLRHDHDRGQFYRIAVLVGDLPLKRECLCRYQLSCQKEQQQ